jgi:hypothetical protein
VSFMGKQTFVVHIEEELARQVTALLTYKDTGYASFDELVSVALLNQLGLESSDSSSPPRMASSQPNSPYGKPQHIPLGSGDALINILGRPAPESPLPLAPEPPDSGQSLFLLTNRLSPLKIAVRVLASLSLRAAWPKTYEFQQTAAYYAREVGLRLLAGDEAASRPGERKRATGYPTGKNLDRSASRYVLAFTIGGAKTQPTGPLAILGLANLIDDDRVALTDAGWQLAHAPSAVLNEAPGLTLSEEEQRFLQIRIASAPSERDAVSEFLRLVRRAAGSQGKLDELLASEHSDWTANLRTANRAAMVGRLSDLGVLTTTGRGPDARIELLEPATEFLEAAFRMAAS